MPSNSPYACFATRDSACSAAAASGQARIVQFVADSPARGLGELLAVWEQLTGVVEDRVNLVERLAERSGVEADWITHSRAVRNGCAHPRPGPRSWPSQRDVDVALATAQDIARAL